MRDKIKFGSILLCMAASALTHHKYSCQIARFVGPTWNPPGDDRTQVGPMLAPWPLLSGMFHHNELQQICLGTSDFTYMKIIFVDFTWINAFDKSQMDTILYQFEIDFPLWKRLKYPPVYEEKIVTNSGNTACGVESITSHSLRGCNYLAIPKSLY